MPAGLNVPLVVGAVAALAFFLFSGRARAAEVSAPEAPDEELPPENTERLYEEISMSGNTDAFLRLIRIAEGTEREGLDPYAVVYSYAFTISDFSAHPAELGWGGVPLPDELCEAAGFSPGCVSTAAGAYQINRPTWRSLGGGSFDPASQDAAAIRLLTQIGALDAIESGDLQTALQIAGGRWASLPSSTAGQPKISIAEAETIFAESGGVVA